MSVRKSLRTATQEAHERVDRRFSRCDFGNIAAYRCFLMAHHAVLPDCEHVLEASEATRLIDDWVLRIRTPALVADLQRLGVTPDAAPSREPATSRRLTPAAAFGMLYVLEGSRLGGAVLARRVAEAANAECREATRYLRHGEGLRLWPSFLAALEASSAVRDDPDAVVASAIETFALFEQVAGVIDVVLL